MTNEIRPMAEYTSTSAFIDAGHPADSPKLALGTNHLDDLQFFKRNAAYPIPSISVQIIRATGAVYAFRRHVVDPRVALLGFLNVPDGITLIQAADEAFEQLPSRVLHTPEKVRGRYVSWFIGRIAAHNDTHPDSVPPSIDPNDPISERPNGHTCCSQCEPSVDFRPLEHCFHPPEQRAECGACPHCDRPYEPETQTRALVRYAGRLKRATP